MAPRETYPYRMAKRPAGPSLRVLAETLDAGDPWAETALRSVLSDSGALVRVFRGVPEGCTVLNPGGEWVSLDPRYAFAHARSVASYQRRLMQVITALVPAREMQGVSGWYGAATVEATILSSPPVVGVPCTPAEVSTGDWMALPSIDATSRDPQFWTRCVLRDDDAVYWECAGGRVPIPLDEVHRVSHLIKSGPCPTDRTST